MKVGDLVRPKQYEFQHLVGIIVDYPKQKWNVTERYVKVRTIKSKTLIIWPDDEWEVLNESR